MIKLKQFAKDFINKEDGVTIIEYALMAVLIVIVVYVAVTKLGGTAAKKFTNVDTKLNSRN